MSAVAKIERQKTALALVKIGLRLSYIQWITGLNDRFLRTLWKEVHGKSPSSGTSYTSVDTGLKTYSLSRISAAFANVYFRSAEDGHPNCLQAETFLAAWRSFEFLGINDNKELTPDMAWQVIRNLVSGTTQRRLCKQCNSSYIRYEKANGLECKCPFCTVAEKRARSKSKSLVITERGTATVA